MTITHIQHLINEYHEREKALRVSNRVLSGELKKIINQAKLTCCGSVAVAYITREQLDHMKKVLDDHAYVSLSDCHHDGAD